ncbi:MAG: hypothetical protein WA280_12375, partial [Xanthobacteraceae bacterium]
MKTKTQRLSDCRELPAQCHWLTGFHQNLSPEVYSAADVRKNADGCDYNRAHEADDYDLQMGGAVGVI